MGNRAGGKPVSGVGKFFVACQNSGIDPVKGRKKIPLDYQISSDQIAASNQKTPIFSYTGSLSSTNCSLEEPFDGLLTCITEPNVEIKSIES